MILHKDIASDNARARSKQNCEVNFDSLKASKHRRKLSFSLLLILLLTLIALSKSKLVNKNGIGEDAFVEKIVER
jgi:hypothetical protein